MQSDSSCNRNSEEILIIFLAINWVVLEPMGPWDTLSPFFFRRPCLGRAWPQLGCLVRLETMQQRVFYEPHGMLCDAREYH